MEPDWNAWVDSTRLSRRQALAGGMVASGFALAAQPVAASVITTPTDGLVAGLVEVKAADRSIPAYRAKPAGGKPRAVVLVVHEVFGLHEHIKDVARRFAQAGFYAIAPDLYVRGGDVTKLASFDEIRPIVAGTPDAQVMSDLDATMRFAGTDGGDVKRLGVTGFCWGGRITWLYAAHAPSTVKAGVAWYGRVSGAPTALQPKNPVDLAPQIKAPVLGLYGSADQGIPVATLDDLKDALAKAGHTSSKFIVYPDAPHAFHADYRPSYRPDVAKAGWSECLAWFGKYLA